MSEKIFGNYHTHTFRCKHATGDVNDYAAAARAAGLRELGLSDHTPLPDDWIGSIRMSMAELDGYTRAIEKASGPDLRVLKGMECDLNPAYYAFYKDELLGRRGYDYLVGALHFYRWGDDWPYAGSFPSSAHLRAYTDQLVLGIRTGLFAFIAHPDHFAAGWIQAGPAARADAAACMRDILAAAAGTGVLLEINGNGFRKPPVQGERGPRPPYPWRPFWELAREYPLKVICNSDAHKPEEVIASIGRCRALAEELGLEVVERLQEVV
jgi:histidinol-phosphatase (PHP family)